MRFRDEYNKVRFIKDNTELFFFKAKYNDNKNTVIVVFSKSDEEEGYLEQWNIPSVNLGNPLPLDFVVIKDYSECEGYADALCDTPYFTKLRSVQIGYGSGYLVKINNLEEIPNLYIESERED